MPVSILVKHNYRNQVSKDGRYPVHIYVKPEREREKYYRVKLPQNPSAEEWQDKTDEWISRQSPYCFQSNQAIRNLKQKIIDVNQMLADSPELFQRVRGILGKKAFSNHWTAMADGMDDRR